MSRACWAGRCSRGAIGGSPRLLRQASRPRCSSTPRCRTGGAPEAFGRRRLLGLTPLFAIGLGEVLGVLSRPPAPWPAAALAGCSPSGTCPSRGLYDSGVVAPRDQAITYDQLAVAQVDALRRRVVEPVRAPAPGAVGLRLRASRRAVAPTTSAVRSGRIDIGREPAALPFLRRPRLVRRGDGRRCHSPPVAREWLVGSVSPSGTVEDYEAVVPPAARAARRPAAPHVRGEPRARGGPPTSARAGPEYRFRVPSRCATDSTTWGFIYSRRRARARPGVAARNAAVAVDWIAFSPARP